MKPSRLAYFILVVPLFFGAGCAKSPFAKSDSQKSAAININDVITQYISANSLLAPTSSGGRVFVAYQDLGEGQNGTTTTRYIWALIQEYYLDHGTLERGTGSSIPLAIHLIHQSGQDIVTGYDAPRDSDYGGDIARIFPQDVAAKMFAHQDVTSLEQMEEKEAADFFMGTKTMAPTIPATTSTAIIPSTLSKSLSEKDKNMTINVKVGERIQVVLHSTFWQFASQKGTALKQLGEPTVAPILTGHIPGSGAGTVRVEYVATLPGRASISASRTSCGEAMLCTGDQGNYLVSVNVVK
jgi:hypothetical protein